MLSTNEQVLARGEKYYQLTTKPEWIAFEEELKANIESLKNDVVESNDNALKDKGRIKGLQWAIELPYAAIKEMQDIKEREETDDGFG